MAFDAHGSIVSPISNAASPVDEAKREDAFSLVEKRACYDEEKIFVTAMPEAQVNRRPSNAPEAVFAAPAPEPVLPKYKETFPEVLPGRPDPIPFWKRHIKWLAAGMLGLAIILAIIVRVSVHAMNSKTTTTMTGSDVQAVLGRNNTLKSVASSGLFLKDGKTWNTQVYWQSSNGSINMQFSLDGKTFQPAKQVKLTFPPKVGSPISATAELDSVGTVVLNLFYLTDISNITTSSISCAPGTDKCNTISNFVIPLANPASNSTGLSAVTVSDVQDWRIYYHGEDGTLSELAGDNTGFGNGTAIGGSALFGSSIAAVNVNSTTNNINVFYVDHLTNALFTVQFASGAWTKPSIVSSELIGSWNPNSGLGASYTVTTDQLHVYYTGIDNGIYEFLESKTSKTIDATWAPQPGRNHLWAEADYPGAAISAVGWKDQARFYQVKQGNLAEGALSGTVWSEAFIERSGNGAGQAGDQKASG